MSGVTLLEDVSVELIQHMGSDASIVHAARVSTGTDVAADFSTETADEHKGLIEYLIRERHGSPLEHTSITFRVEAPIFVFREWHRHRVQSYNELSGRYSELEPRFYVPDADRPLINVGTSARPTMAPAHPDIVDDVRHELEEAYQVAWSSYQRLLATGIAKEVARLVLPVGIMSKMYATANLRAWMHFLSLRTEYEGALFHSRPQREIAMAAEKVEAHLVQLFPLAMAAFAKTRVAP